MKKLLLAILCSTATSLSFADDLAWNEHKGAYAELNAGTNAYYLGIISSEGNTSGSGIIGTGLNAAIGYNFTPIFALEGGFTYAFADVNNGEKIDVPYVTTRFTAPIGNRLSFIGKVGLMVPYVPNEGGMVLPYTGVGFGYALTKNLEANVQYQGAIYGIAGAGLLGLGLTYHFE